MRYTRVLTAAAATVLVGSGLAAVLIPASADEPLSGAAQAEKALRGASDRSPALKKDATGRVRSVVARPGHPLRRPESVAGGGSAESTARGFLRTYGAAMGLPDGDKGITHLRTDKVKDGVQFVRLQQEVAGLPVLGGEVVVASKPNGDILSVTSELAETGAVPAALVAKDTAIRSAVASIAKGAKVAAKTLSGTATKWLYDANVLNSRAPHSSLPVWRVAVTSASNPEADHEVLVDAEYGDIVLITEAHQHAKQRIVCDYANVKRSMIPACGPNNAARVENGPQSAVVEVNKAFDVAGMTYDFYANNFGRDSIDGKGMTVTAAVRACTTTDRCPYDNAYWQDGQAVFGDGYERADDVVAHEFTHGVTESTSGLYYAFQSGAINESLSDIMGEFIDQLNPDAGTKDGPAWDWKLGEDLAIGAIRRMDDPTLILYTGDIADPDRMTSPHYFAARDGDPTEPNDDGGVHINSGVGNKTAYLIAAPGTGTFNGVSVTGIGIPKAAQVYYRVMNLLTSGSDYADLAVALNNACTQLQAAGTADITADDCTQVSAAVTATELTKSPVVETAKAPQAPTCPTGATPSVVAADGFETGPTGLWSLGAPNWSYEGQGSPDANAKEGKVATLGLTRFRGANDPLTKASGITWTTPLKVPAGKGTFLRFAHDTWFESRGGKNFDGGRVEYRVDGGGWTDAGGLFTHNGYTGAMATESGFGASRAFTGNSRGYISSRLDLSSFAGRTVEMRFIILGNDLNQSYWWLDDVQVFTCSGAAASPIRGLTATGTPGSATLSWLAPEVSGPTPASEYKLAADPAIPSLPTTVPAGKESAVVNGLADKSGYTFTVTPVYGTADGAPVTVTTKPTTVTIGAAPAAITAGGKVVLSGQASIVGGGAGSYASVRVIGRLVGKTEWTQVATTTTWSAGNWGVTLAPTANNQYAAQFVNGMNLGSSQSATITVGVAPTVTLKPSKTPVPKGTTISFGGTTKPTVPYVGVTLQVLSGKTWKTAGTARTLSGGNFGLQLKMNTKGTFAYRVIVAGDATHMAATSPTVTVKVT